MVTPQATQRSGHRDRRRSVRFPVLEQIDWRVARGRRTYKGQLVERSLDGFAFLAAASEAPSAGACIHPVIRRPGRRPMVFKAARIVRAEAVAGMMHLVAAEIEA